MAIMDNINNLLSETEVGMGIEDLETLFLLVG